MVLIGAVKVIDQKNPHELLAEEVRVKLRVGEQPETKEKKVLERVKVKVINYCCL